MTMRRITRRLTAAVLSACLALSPVCTLAEELIAAQVELPLSDGNSMLVPVPANHTQGMWQISYQPQRARRVYARVGNRGQMHNIYHPIHSISTIRHNQYTAPVY